MMLLAVRVVLFTFTAQHQQLGVFKWTVALEETLHLIKFF